jgi:hypothetical protein
MYYWPIHHFYVETKSLKKFISLNKLLFARHYHSLLPSPYYVPPKKKHERGEKYESAS